MIVMSEDRILFKQSKIGTRAQGWLHGREKQPQLPRPVTTKLGPGLRGLKMQIGQFQRIRVKVSSPPHCPVKGGTGK